VPRGELYLDVEAFEAAATARRSREPAAYRAALNLYTGELLPRDPYEEWAEGRREELRQLFLALLVELASLHKERGEYGPGIEALRRVVVEEPTREEAHIGLMRLYALGGRQAEALAQYARLEEFLSRELGAEPQAASRALREEIAAGRFPPPHRPISPPKGEIFDPPRHNLPATRTSFVGREREIVEVKRALSMTRLLTLTGAGGSGKTRLALEVARDLVGAYPDGVWLVELAGLSEGKLVPHAVAGALRVKERPSQPITVTLGEFLRAKQMLLVVDNCEHLIDAVGELVALLLDSCPRLRILATSREALGAVGEVIWPVSLLSVPDLRSPPTVARLEAYEAIRLFVDRARQRKPAFALRPENSQAVAQICVHLEGLPLAIELAAARIKTLPPWALLGRLEDRLKLLTGGPREVSERQRTLRSTIEWSYELLDEGEPALFGRLSVFSGGATLESIERVCDTVGGVSVDALEGVSSLLDKSLLWQEEGAGDEPRFVMLETIREYAQERLEESGEAETTKRAHAKYFLAITEEAEPELWGPEDAAWSNRLEREHDNMRAALSWSIEHDEVELALRLGGALRWFWNIEGYYGEGRNWLEATLDKGERASAQARAKALEGVGWLADKQGDLDRAEAAAEEGFELSAEAKLSELVAAEFQNVLGDVTRQRGDYERAARLIEESLALYQEARDQAGIAWSLGNLANVEGDRGDHERAKQLYEAGIARSRQLGGSYPLSEYLISPGYTLLLEGDLEKTTALNEEAADLLRQRGRRGGLQYALDNLGWAALLQGKFDKAKALHNDSLILCKELGDKAVTSESLEGLACTAGAKGDTERAARLFGAAEALREATGHLQRPRERALREPYLEAARSRLDEAAWEKAFTEGKAMELGEAVEYALAKVEESAPHTPPALEEPSAAKPPVALTRREREVASLVAQDLTNRQIASELFISERTVDHHVEKILRKLDLSSREQVASRLAE
jgi:predicted ATPase/DNA-binding CsgD family transcriptional regulator